MNTHVRIVVALLLGVLVFAVTTVVVTAGFEPQIEFSLLIGLPVGVSAGLTALFAGYVLLWHRAERRRVRSPSVRFAFDWPRWQPLWTSSRSPRPALGST